MELSSFFFLRAECAHQCLEEELDAAQLLEKFYHRGILCNRVSLATCGIIVVS